MRYKVLYSEYCIVENDYQDKCEQMDKCWLIWNVLNKEISWDRWFQLNL